MILEQKRLIGRLSTMAAALGDQALYSGSHFLINVFLARWIASVDYGGFSIAYTFFGFALTLQSAILIEPLYICGASTYSGRVPAYLKQVLSLQLLFGLFVAVSLGAVAYFVQNPHVGVPLRALAFSIPFMLLVSLLRAEFYLMRMPIKALQLSAFYFITNSALLIGLRSAGRLDSATAMLALGSSSGAVVLYWIAIRERKVSQIRSVPVTLTDAAREHYLLGKWLVASATFGIGINVFPTWFTAFHSGLEAAAGFRALVNLILPIGQSLTAASNVLLPRLSAQWLVDKDKFTETFRQALVLTAAVCGTFFCFCAYYRNEVEWCLFRGQYKALVTVIPIMCAMPIAQATGVLYSVALRAMRFPGDQTKSAAFQCVLGIGTALLLIPKYGVLGTTWSFLLTNAAGAVLMATLYYLRVARRLVLLEPH